MPAPTPPAEPIPVPTPPDRTDKSTFITRSFIFTNWYIPFQAWLVTVVTFITTSNTWVESQNIAAGNSATTASNAAVSASASAASALQQPGTNATSTSTITPVIGTNSFTLAQTGKNFVVNQFVTVANSNTKYFNGIITAFDAGTGAMTVDARVVQGSGSASAWTITAAAPANGELFTAPVQTFVELGSVSGTVTVDLRAGLKQSLTTSGNITIAFTLPNLAASTTEVEAVLLITKGGSHTITWPVGTQFSDGAAPAQASGATTEYVATKQGSGNWIVSASRKNIA